MTSQVTTTEYGERLARTLPAVRERIARAAASAGRDHACVRLVAVTKAHPFEAVEAAIAAGVTDLGENRVEELESKVARFGRGAATWHMIGHVQSRKAGRAVEVADLLHSVDSTKLALKIARAGEENGRPAPVLIQVNVSGENAKHGLPAESAVDDVLELAELPGLRVDGLMTMAPFVDDEAVLAQTFSGLRRTLESLRSHSDRIGAELSMGMTNDLDIAIREGSTMVRIGTALFGPRAPAE